MADNTILPSMNVTGRFEVLAPFDRVVSINTTYTVKAMRAITEMQGLNVNIYQRVFVPLGVDETTYETMLKEGLDADAMVITLTPRQGSPVYVLSNYLKSFPITDGFLYERMCLIVDLGALAISMKESLEEAQTHFKDWVLAHYGINAEVRLGTIPLLGYVSQFEHETLERTRQNRITDDQSDLAKQVALEKTLLDKEAYIVELEARLGVTR